MKKQLFTLVVTASFLSVVKPAFADSTSNSNSDGDLQKVMAQTTTLESEVKALKKEIRQLKSAQKQLKNKTEQAPAVTYTVVKTPGTSSDTGNTTPLKNSPVTYLSGTPVVIAPYIGEHSAFDSFDLIVNYSNYNQDLLLLQLRQQMNQQYRDAGAPLPDSPMLMLSGKIEGQAIAQSPYNNGNNVSQIDLSSAELDVIPTINQWANGYIAFAYDHSSIPNSPVVTNSRTYVKRAFLTFGNLDQFPIYLTMGQINVPFGVYGSYMISDTIPTDIFQTRARTILLGYQGKNGKGPYAEVFAFNGDSNTNHNNNINNVGANAGFKFSCQTVKGDLGVSGIANIADSLGMQKTGLPEGFQGFSVSKHTPEGPSAEFLKRQVPGISVHGNLGIGPFGLLGEYETATSAFDPHDMTFNNHGAQPRALDLEATYNFHVFDRPSVVTAAYDKTWEALALGVPQNRYMFAFLTSIWKSTIEEIEFRHDVNYGVTDSASGAGVITPASMKGGSSNTVTAQIGIYF